MPRRPLDVPIDVHLTPRQCFGLASLLDTDRAVEDLTECLIEDGAQPEQAETCARALVAEIHAAPYRHCTVERPARSVLVESRVTRPA